MLVLLHHILLNEKSSSLVQEHLNQCPFIWHSISTNVNIILPLPHEQTWILDINSLWHHFKIYSCQSLWSTLKIIGVGCWEMEMYRRHQPLTNWTFTYIVFLRHFIEHWGWCSWLHGLALMVCPKLHKFWQS
jgi:hypothetical protein